MTQKSKSETPLMKQYYEIKRKNEGALLLFRVGDFYETFDEDARTASKVLGIVLTKRANGAASEMDLAGFPYHSLDSYLPKLVRAGYRVAICEQLEDPKLTKTIVKRGVTELVTPGVSFNDKVLDAQQSNYLCAIYLQEINCGLAFLDISTGDFLATQGSFETIKKLIDGFKPAEILYAKNQLKQGELLLQNHKCVQHLDDWVFELNYAEEKLNRQFKTQTLKGFGIAEMPLAMIAAGACLQYLENTQHNQISHISSIKRIETDKFVWLDGFTIRNLELVNSIFPEGNSLLKIIDKTSTPMGSRLLQNWMLLPLLDINEIEYRQNIVEAFCKESPILIQTHALLEQIGDLQRLVSKVALQRISPREILQLARSCKASASLIDLLKNSTRKEFAHAVNGFTDVQSLISKIETEIHSDAPAVIGKAAIFATGVNEELDKLKKLAFHGKDYLLQLQKKEQESTGIPSLKIGFNNVFGYYLEVTHAHKNKVPEVWIRKQTLTNAERYITPELKEYEEKILSAESEIEKLEQNLWQSFLNYSLNYVSAIQRNAQIIAAIDVLAGYATVSSQYNYCKPTVNDSEILYLENSRHPVIEQQLPPTETYIPNTIEINKAEQRIIILTGPNMSGKSAILRQTALSVILAQIGCFVPCTRAEIGIVDKIYTRVGASDNISLGESTFMVEMIETAGILNNLSSRSLILLDEIGRGTSTYDGVSLAWSIAEYLQSHPCQPKTLFATHYHELNELENKMEGIVNYHVAIKESTGKIIFLRKLQKGGSEHSFGIHVAQMAGIPNKVLLRANEILKNLETDRASLSGRETLKKTKAQPVYQMSMFQTEDPIVQQLKSELIKLDINSFSPIDALLKLQELKNTVSKLPK